MFERVNDALSATLYSSRELNKKIAEENLRLAEQQKQHQEYLNRVVYKNQPTAAFYEQFNKGTRWMQSQFSHVLFKGIKIDANFT